MHPKLLTQKTIQRGKEQNRSKNTTKLATIVSKHTSKYTGINTDGESRNNLHQPFKPSASI